MIIIEKLGRKTPHELKIIGDVWKVYELAGLPKPKINELSFEQGNQIKKLLDSRNEMLEALIKVANYCENLNSMNDFQLKETLRGILPSIESATGKPWEKTKELLK